MSAAELTFYFIAGFALGFLIHKLFFTHKSNNDYISSIELYLMQLINENTKLTIENKDLKRNKSVKRNANEARERISKFQADINEVAGEFWKGVWDTSMKERNCNPNLGKYVNESPEDYEKRKQRYYEANKKQIDDKYFYEPKIFDDEKINAVEKSFDSWCRCELIPYGAERGVMCDKLKDVCILNKKPPPPPEPPPGRELGKPILPNNQFTPKGFKK